MPRETLREAHDRSQAEGVILVARRSDGAGYTALAESATQSAVLEACGVSGERHYVVKFHPSQGKVLVPLHDSLAPGVYGCEPRGGPLQFWERNSGS